MDKILIDVTLLKACLYAFNEIPNRRLSNGKSTYELASQIDRAFVSNDGVQINDSAEVDRYIDAECISLTRLISSKSGWDSIPAAEKYVRAIQTAVIAIGKVDRYNYNMDMLSRADLVIVS